MSEAEEDILKFSQESGELGTEDEHAQDCNGVPSESIISFETGASNEAEPIIASSSGSAFGIENFPDEVAALTNEGVSSCDFLKQMAAKINDNLGLSINESVAKLLKGHLSRP